MDVHQLLRTRAANSSLDQQHEDKKRSSKNLRTINLKEVAWHDSQDDCWVTIYDYVYDCTQFLERHPGGADVLMEYAGRDATLAFVGSGHSEVAKQMLDKYLIGELPVNERIFRIHGGVKIIET